MKKIQCQGHPSPLPILSR